MQLQAWGLFVLEFMDEKKAKREKQSKPQEEHACLLYQWVSKKIKSCVPEIEKILIFNYPLIKYMINDSILISKIAGKAKKEEHDIEFDKS